MIWSSKVKKNWSVYLQSVHLFFRDNFFPFLLPSYRLQRSHVLQLYLELLLLLGRELQLRQDDTLLLLLLMLEMMRRMRLIDEVVRILRRLLGAAGQHDPPLDARVGDAGDARRRNRFFRRLRFHVAEGISRRRRMRRRRRKLVLSKLTARLLCAECKWTQSYNCLVT